MVKNKEKEKRLGVVATEKLQTLELFFTTDSKS